MVGLHERPVKTTKCSEFLNLCPLIREENKSPESYDRQDGQDVVNETEGTVRANSYLI